MGTNLSSITRFGAKMVNLNTRDQGADAVNANCAKIISTALQEPCTLFLSGGSTPGPIYTKMSQLDINWENIALALVDDRWVNETDPGSNGALIRRTLISNKAQNAKFIPMKNDAPTPQLGASDVENAYAALPTRCVAILGMGPDGHTASWFSGAQNYRDIISLDNHNITAPITAPPTDVTGIYLDRMTITRHKLQACAQVFLIIKGNAKKQLLEMWCSNNTDLPILHALKDLGSKMTVLTIEEE